MEESFTTRNKVIKHHFLDIWQAPKWNLEGKETP